MRPLYKLGNAAVAALPRPQHAMPHMARAVLRTCRREEFSLFRLSFSFPCRARDISLSSGFNNFERRRTPSAAELGVYVVQGVSCRRTRGVNHRLGPVNRRYAACSAAFDAGRKESDCHSPGRALASGRMAPDALP